MLRMHYEPVKRIELPHILNGSIWSFALSANVMIRHILLQSFIISQLKISSHFLTSCVTRRLGVNLLACHILSAHLA
jgi:hypothetical protein